MTAISEAVKPQEGSQTEETRRYWKPKEVAEYFRTSVTSVLKWIHTDRIEAIVLPSGRYIIPDRAITKLKETNFKPEWVTAEEVRARFEERERRKAAAIAIVNNFKATLTDKRRKRNVNSNAKTK